MHEIVQVLVPLLEQRLGTGERFHCNGFYLEHAFVTPDLAGFASFMFWFVSCGFAWPIHAQDGKGVSHLCITDTGFAFLATKDDHPLLPGFVDRLVKRCPGIPDDIVTLLIDAKACLDHALMRPAVVLAGVAYEMAVDRIAGSLVAKGHLTAADVKVIPAVLLNVVKSKVKILPEKEHQYAAEAACDFADQLRRRRNDGAHKTPTYSFEDREEAEEFVISAGRHMPHLWRLYQP